MTGNGTSFHGNGNGKRVWRNIGLESTGFAVAEGVSMLTSLGVVAIADQVIPGPLKAASKFLSKTIIEPHIEKIEAVLGKLCQLEECKADVTRAREARAEAFSKVMITFGAAWLASFYMKFAARRMMNKALGIQEEELIKKGWDHLKLSKKEAYIALLDEGVHYGSLLLMNTGLSSVTDDYIRTTTKVLERNGVSHEKAHEVSSMLWIWELPNFLGLIAGIGGIAGAHHYGWGAKPFAWEARAHQRFLDKAGKDGASLMAGKGHVDRLLHASGAQELLPGKA